MQLEDVDVLYEPHLFPQVSTIQYMQIYAVICTVYPSMVYISYCRTQILKRGHSGSKMYQGV